jgi:hypothetical protein
LHGNHARVKPDKTISPLFKNCVTNPHFTRDGTVFYNRLTDLDDEFAKKEVDDNAK